MKNIMNIGDLLIFIIYSSHLSYAITKASQSNAELKANKCLTDRLLSELTKINVSESRTKIVDPFQDFVFENVSFSYSGNSQKVLEHINLIINQGDRLAIIGRSGSGKTTLIKMLIGLINPNEGVVMCNGHNMLDIDLDSLHKGIGIVMQENIFFNGSIKENLWYGKMDATEKEMEEACKKAYIYDFIVGLPKGLETIIGEKGINLSGGQRQRLALARVFLRSPDIYIFDEVTSNLDPYSEKYICDAIANIDSNKTVIFVSHRESYKRLCNKIYSLDENKML